MGNSISTYNWFSKFMEQQSSVTTGSIELIYYLARNIQLSRQGYTLKEIHYATEYY